MKAEQFREMLEWSGWRRYVFDDCGMESYEWVCPDGTRIDYLQNQDPPQDMNTLFRWMVPKLRGFTLIQTPNGKYSASFVTVIYQSDSISDDPFEALAQAIYKVVKDD